jgi:hypothetical protein
VEGTRFHPTFAYEMILNILLGLLLLWIARQYIDKMKPGAIFAGWLVSAGLIRTFIEFFRPDQPRIGDTFITSSMAVSFLMAVAGVLMLLVRYGKWQPGFAENWEEEYQIKPVDEPGPRAGSRTLTENIVEEKKEVNLKTEAASPEPVKRKAFVKAKPKATSKASGTTTRKTTTVKKTTKPKTSK